jgi:hypothetical protein
MSCYEWERGDIVIPKKNWASFRSGLLKKWNAQQMSYLETAQRLHSTIKDAIKGKRGKLRTLAMREVLTARYGEFSENEEKAYVTTLLLKASDEERPWNLDTLQKPKKKALKLLAVTKSCSFFISGDVYIGFNNDSHTVTWDVSENNHACERARDHWFAKELFSALSRITFIKGTGGEIYGNNEYSRDAEGSGGGGNYQVAAYGPNGKR